MKYFQKLQVLLIIAIIGVGLSACSVTAKVSDSKSNQESDNKLYLGIMNANLEQVKEGLKEGANIDKMRVKLLAESNPVRLALKEQQNKIARYLIENGADANNTDKS